MNEAAVWNIKNGAQRLPATLCFSVCWQGLAAGHGSNDAQRLLPCNNGFGQGRVWRLVRDIQPAGEEADVWPALFGGVLSNRAPQHRMAGFQRI